MPLTPVNAFSTAHVRADVIARNRGTPSIGMGVEVIDRYGWTASIATGGRHQSVLLVAITRYAHVSAEKATKT